jgi:hypothetical protein
MNFKAVYGRTRLPEDDLTVDRKLAPTFVEAFSMQIQFIDKRDEYPGIVGCRFTKLVCDEQTV